MTYVRVFVGAVLGTALLLSGGCGKNSEPPTRHQNLLGGTPAGAPISEVPADRGILEDPTTYQGAAGTGAGSANAEEAARAFMDEFVGNVFAGDVTKLFDAATPEFLGPLADPNLQSSVVGVVNSLDKVCDAWKERIKEPELAAQRATWDRVWRRLNPQNVLQLVRYEVLNDNEVALGIDAARALSLLGDLAKTVDPTAPTFDLASLPPEAAADIQNGVAKTPLRIVKVNGAWKLSRAAEASAAAGTPPGPPGVSPGTPPGATPPPGATMELPPGFLTGMLAGILDQVRAVLDEVRDFIAEAPVETLKDPQAFSAALEARLKEKFPSMTLPTPPMGGFKLPSFLGGGASGEPNAPGDMGSGEPNAPGAGTTTPVEPTPTADPNAAPPDAGGTPPSDTPPADPNAAPSSDTTDPNASGGTAGG